MFLGPNVAPAPQSPLVCCLGQGALVETQNGGWYWMSFSWSYPNGRYEVENARGFLTVLTRYWTFVFSAVSLSYSPLHGKLCIHPPAASAQVFLVRSNDGWPIPTVNCGLVNGLVNVANRRCAAFQRRAGRVVPGHVDTAPSHQQFDGHRHLCGYFSWSSMGVVSGYHFICDCVCSLLAGTTTLIPRTSLSRMVSR